MARHRVFVLAALIAVGVLVALNARQHAPASTADPYILEAGDVGAQLQGAPPRVGPDLNVVLISIDTLRADHLGCYGYPEPTSPAIDALAAQGALFETAISQSSATLPSHASLFTSRYPSQHKTISSGHQYTPLAGVELTLAEVLHHNGYRTAAFTDGGEMAGMYQIGQGFDDFDDLGGASDTILPKAMDWLSAHHDDPFFLFLHFYDVHGPFVMTELDRARRKRIEELYEAEPGHGLDLEPAALAALLAAYDRALLGVDTGIQGLLDHLDGLGRSGDTLVVVLSDHGEEFMEHDLIGHGVTVYEEVLRVPLIL